MQWSSTQQFKEKEPLIPTNNVNVSQKHCAGKKQQHTEEYILCVSIYMKF